MRFLPLLILAAASSTLTLGQSIPAAVSSTTTLPSVQARSSASVVDGFGVGVHMAYLDTPYRDPTAVADALTGLGVSHVRDDLFIHNKTQYAAMRMLASKGIKFDLIMGNPKSPRPARDYVAAVADDLPGVVESLEGPNEWDHFSGGVAGWPSQLRTRQTALFAAAKENPRTAGLPVLGPSLAFAKNYPLVGDLSSMADASNGHLYPGGRPPSADVSTLYAKLRSTTGLTKPIVITEAGYHNALQTTGGHPPVPESVHATYLPRLLMEHLRAGASRVYTYELIDEFADPGQVNLEANFGLLHRDLTPKPAYTAMQRLLAVFRDSNASFAPDSLTYSVDGGRSDLRQLLVQKSDGEFDLVLWRDVSVWDPITRRAISPSPYRVQVRLGQSFRATVVTPRTGDTSSLGPVDAVPVDLGADVTVVRLPAAAPVATTLAAPTALRATVGSASATLTWKAPAGTSAATFVVRRTPGNTVSTIPGGGRSYTARGLRNGVRYHFSVQARNEHAVSAPTPVVSVIPATTPGRSPKVTVRPATASVRVAWRAPRSGGSPVTAYRLTVGSISRRFSPAARAGEVRGLPRRADVRVRFDARNAVGWGAASWSGRVRTH